MTPRVKFGPVDYEPQISTAKNPANATKTAMLSTPSQYLIGS